MAGRQRRGEALEGAARLDGGAGRGARVGGDRDEGAARAVPEGGGAREMGNEEDGDRDELLLDRLGLERGSARPRVIEGLGGL